MKGKVFKTAVILLLILLLTMSDFVLIGYNFVIAVSENLGEQNVTTNISNVDFDVYLKQEETKVYEKQVNMDLGDTLILYISVKDKGILNDAKIQMNNANFKIKNPEVQNTYIKEINEETNEISLNSIASGNDIEIEIPIQFNKEEVFDINYFAQENIINMTGIYKDETEQSVMADRKIKIDWQTDLDISLNQSIEKFIGLGTNGVLIQQNITTEVPNNQLPREQEILDINVPVIQEQKPNEIYVLLNGEKIEQENINYNKENNLLEIKNIKTVNTENQLNWGSAQNIYKIIYIYPSEIGEENKTIEISTQTRTKLYTKDEIQKLDTQNIEIAQMGNIVDVETKILSEQVYKGYLYAKTQNEITFEEEENINISYANEVENIQIETLDNQFANDEGQEFTAVNSILYKGISINQNNMLGILGQNANITVQDENGEIISTINASTQPDENGNINITYNEPKKNIKIITSKPEIEGILQIKHIKSIKGESDYTKEQLKTFTRLISRNNVIAGLGEDLGEAVVLLQDTKTEAKLEVSNTNLSTLQDNTNVQLLITLKSNNEQYDLYKNPSIEIILPKELSVNVKNIAQLNRQGELAIVHPTMHKNENGDTIIQLQLQGEQTTFENDINEGIQISITADISVDKTVPSMSSQIVMNYTNENRPNETFNYQLPLTVNSKYGVLLINKLSNYNENGDTLESTDDKVKEATIEANVDAKAVQQQITVLNNYESDITDISLIGRLPENGEEVINDEILEATFGTKLLNDVEATGKIARIYYSEDVNATADSDTWKEQVEDFTNIKSFKLELEDNKLEPGGVLNIASEIEVPAELGYEESSYINTNLNYNYLGDNMQTTSTISLRTTSENEEIINPNEEEPVQKEDLSVEIQARTGGEYLNNEDTVKEGQGIKYLLKLTNNTEEPMTNIKVTATHTNAIFYDEIVYNDGWDSLTDDQNAEYTRIEENEDLKEKVFEIETLEPGESIDLNYQFSVKEVVGDLEKTSGQILVEADNQEEKTIETIENPIEQAEIKIQMRNKYSEEYPVATSNALPFFLDITNISSEVQNNIVINLPVPENFDFETELLFETGGFEFIEYKDNVITLEIPTLEVEETLNIRLSFLIKGIDLDLKQEDFDFYYTANIGDKVYISNEMSRTIYQDNGNITAVQTGSIESEEVDNGNNLIYTATIENNSEISKLISITDMVPNGAVINSVKIQLYDITTEELISQEDIEANEYNLVSYETELEPQRRLVLIIDTTIDTDQIFGDTITNQVDITVPGEEVVCNEVSYKVKGREPQEIPGDQEESIGIKGVVWLDQNKNGMRENSEQLLENVGVILINEETGQIVTNENGEECVTVTGSAGGYEFNDLQQGRYLVVFKYDTSKYLVTEYQKSGISETRNSDVISKTITLEGSEQQVAITGSLALSDTNLENIDAGFVESDEFDLRLDKYVSKVIVQNKLGTKVTQFNKEKLAKIEIDAKAISNSTVIIEYQIEVQNEGDVPGYINEIVDYAPKDLNFSSEMNKNWYQGVDGSLYTKELSDQIINPGETKTVTLTLTKTINQNNTGNIVNTAEINTTSNNLSLQDMDSTPGNQRQGEDDISTAEVLVSIRTGEVVGYTILTITIIAIIGIGIYLINKKVLNNDEEEF